MARLPRFVLAGLPHHVVQHGHNRQPIVADDEDRRMWLSLLRDVALAQGVSVHAWVLFDDHFHLIATPPSATALSRMMQALGRRYVGWFNRRHARSGTLWEGRFRAAALEPSRWLLACMRYVELHPVRAGMVVTAAEHRWSSFAHHVGERADPLVTDHPAYWALGNTPFERHAAFRRLVEAGLGRDDLAAITAATRRGWPLGAPEFIAEAQSTSIISLTPRPRGRPKKRSLTSAI
jgi:putative transposase